MRLSQPSDLPRSIPIYFHHTHSKTKQKTLKSISTHPPKQFPSPKRSNGLFPPRRQPGVAVRLGKPNSMMMFRRIFRRESFLPFLNLIAFHPITNILNLIKYFLHILLAPHLLNLNLIFPHHDLCQFLLNLAIGSRGSLELMGQGLDIFDGCEFS